MKRTFIIVGLIGLIVLPFYARLWAVQSGIIPSTVEFISYGECQKMPSSQSYPSEGELCADSLREETNPTGVMYFNAMIAASLAGIGITIWVVARWIIQARRKRI